MENQAIDYQSLAERQANSTRRTDEDRFAVMVAVATITWALLTCLSAFIYCCTYGRLFKAAVDSDSELDSQSELELDLELQSMLPKD